MASANTSGRLTTHILNTSTGEPAGNLSVTLLRLPEPAETICRVRTNSDGRVDAPLLQGKAMQAGRYQLIFEAGAYFRALGIELPEVPFLDDVVLQFGIDAADRHYHVPLLLSPYGYSTYRGS